MGKGNRVGGGCCFVHQPDTNDKSYRVQKSKPQNRCVTGAHASEAALLARAPGRRAMMARAMGITRAEDLPDRDHTVREVKEPATNTQHG